MMHPDEGKTLAYTVDGVTINVTYPHKLYWPGQNIHKIDVIRYYHKLAPYILPYFKNRPVTLHCFPQGIHGVHFYRKDFKEVDPALFRITTYHEKTKDKVLHIPLIDKPAGIAWMVNKGCFEFHLWSALAPRFSFPDILIFDLDVQKNTPFENVLKATLILREKLEEKGLKSYPKTSGGSGMHVYVPVYPEFSFEEVRIKLKSFVQSLIEAFPDVFDFPEKGNKTHSGNKVMIDINQNTITRNTAAPYTVRAFKDAPVSTPLTWDEVEQGGFLPTDFNLKNTIERLEQRGDAFSGVLSQKQKFVL